MRDNNQTDAIGQPSVMARLNETLGYLSTLERHCSDMDGSLFGRGENSPKRETPSTLEGMMAEACERTSTLCSWLGTIKNSLGCPNSESPAPQGYVGEVKRAMNVLRDR